MAPQESEGVLQIISFVLFYGLHLHISHTEWSKKGGREVFQIIAFLLLSYGLCLQM